ncbi:MAG TPA: hypothetical protein VK558_14215 [Patescibacteria group bacterium]|nr:hypothetical protein [Patescibacteria group bacterium]
MTAPRVLIIIVCSVLVGLSAGIGGTISFIDAKDRQIAALTASLDQLRQQLAADEADRREAERKMKAFNRVDQPPKFATPQTFQGGFQ